MIRYNLICAHDHEFEAWFSGSKDFDDQAAQGYLLCPHCGTHKVEKAIMAPNISTARKKEATAKRRDAAMKMMNAAADTIRKEISEKCDYVGDTFADEARAIHYGEKPKRGIYGEASPSEAQALQDEGVGIAPLPDAIMPKPKNQIN